jgi:hypothetical protein
LNADRVRALAEKAGIYWSYEEQVRTSDGVTTDELARFAALIEADSAAKIAKALAFIDERCDAFPEFGDSNHSWRCNHYGECRCGYSKALAEIKTALATKDKADGT